ncbi:hypothetical protein D915_011120 [Fasciola hepatica]|uniref:Uncharacterized protein n=1 Tax=Fasciola hepatica TaxID=6192 RepID=A0A4E0QYR1_FASHE|nr:hypothetical protein D915_011120 [Fasciola hepatica]
MDLNTCIPTFSFVITHVLTLPSLKLSTNVSGILLLRFEPRCCGFHADRDQSGGEDDDDKNDHDEGSEQEIQESDSESNAGPPRARLQFVEPQSEPEPRDDQILLLVSQCLTTDSEADRPGTNIAHPLRYRMLRAL